MQPDMPQMPPPQPAVPSQNSRQMNRLLIPFILVVVLLLGTAGFAFWAYSGMQDYKNNVDSKVKDQLAAAVGRAEEAKEAEFVEREKEPLKDYKGPGAFGSVVIKYPKTWSSYVEETGSGTPVNGYFHPNFVPATDSETAFALRVEVLEEDYARVLEDFDSASEKGEVKVTAIKPVNVAGVTGARIDGLIDRDKRGSVVLFPLRDKTLRLTTQAEQYIKDFNRIILANLTFTP